ncbi:hypothetical protein D0962_05050 [Leptolyngbyaceae cyanobacterium CCMR0082]|uniref:NfeD-like C-terminal domain-containing protein n=2 Tax=Adonisia turfae TaxID=2950184 RepID=A0A6M0S0Z2_9CYAN|nr:NfeD family protein [Adonisia turfae]MDV3349126.1 NfeD family protein [Leptothoe sp. LEGE 181152]NEZ57030.1 hypothetical protein [Adonisia turfae CCMR0081]NEZ62149.1 hypothetical protein [Adonisia turfae CCMR0082]
MSIRPFWKKVFSLDTTTPPSEALGFLKVQGRVIELIEPGSVGRVQLQGVSWLARCADALRYPLPVDTPVQVIDRNGLVLLIKPVLPLPVVNFPLSEPDSVRYLTRQLSTPSARAAA